VSDGIVKLVIDVAVSTGVSLEATGVPYSCGVSEFPDVST
jgi:hypothetical protein